MFDDVTGVNFKVAYLCGEAAIFISGAEILMDGGMVLA